MQMLQKVQDQHSVALGGRSRRNRLRGSPADSRLASCGDVFALCVAQYPLNLRGVPLFIQLSGSFYRFFPPDGFDGFGGVDFFGPPAEPVLGDLFATLRVVVLPPLFRCQPLLIVAFRCGL